MRAFLRADPDVIMVGEMRDHETAATGVEASLTGHLVFSTLHTNDAVSGITRLLDMGIEPFLLASVVRCFLAQRLVRACADSRFATVAIFALPPVMQDASASDAKDCFRPRLAASYVVLKSTELVLPPAT